MHIPLVSADGDSWGGGEPLPLCLPLPPPATPLIAFHEDEMSLPEVTAAFL